MIIQNVNNRSEVPDQLRLDVPLVHFDPWPFHGEEVKMGHEFFVDSTGQVTENEEAVFIDKRVYPYLGATTHGRTVPVHQAYACKILGGVDF